MYLYHLCLRAASAEAAVELCRLARQVFAFFPEPGFIRGTCVVDVNDPQAVCVLEEWGNLPAVQAWITSPARANLERQVMHLTEGPQSWHRTVYQEL